MGTKKDRDNTWSKIRLRFFDNWIKRDKLGNIMKKLMKIMQNMIKITRQIGKIKIYGKLEKFWENSTEKKIKRRLLELSLTRAKNCINFSDKITNQITYYFIKPF